MQVFKAFYKSLRRQITSVLLYVIAFAAISVIMANTMSENTDTLFTAKKLTIAVFDHDNTDESRVLYNYLDRTQNLTSIKDDNEAIADELFFRNVDYVLIIPDGFSENPDSLKNVKQQNSSSAYFLDNSIDTFLNVFFNFRNTGYSCDEAARLTYDCIGSAQEATLLSNTRQDDAQITVQNIERYFHYLPYIFIATVITSLGGLLLIFREKNVNYRIRCSAVSTVRHNTALALACLTYSILLWLVFMVLALAVCGKGLLSVRGLMLVINSFVFLLVSVGITYLISFLAYNPNILNMWSNVIGLCMSFLCGVFIPMEFLGKNVIKAAHFLPAYWYIRTDELCTQYTGTSSELKTYAMYLGIQLLFAFAAFSAALVISRYKKDSVL